jgi:hypothetical protein
MTDSEQTGWYQMLAWVAEDAAAGRLDPDPAVVARKRRQKRMERATATLRDAPPSPYPRTTDGVCGRATGDGRSSAHGSGGTPADR